MAKPNKISLPEDLSEVVVTNITYDDGTSKQIVEDLSKLTTEELFKRAQEDPDLKEIYMQRALRDLKSR